MPDSWPSRNSVIGLGMNQVELSRNPALSSYVVQDLNQQPQLPFEDASFDLVCCAMSIDYITQPRELMSEVSRVLRKNGIVAFSFSDRVFATKAIALWMSSGNEDHIYTVASYFYYTPSLTDIDAVDISPRKLGTCSGDPLYVVTARRV
ncbi:Methyltransferase [Gracilaria domingensis]|nr:Methyltransferase [Gracilaria domingensis]